MSADPHQYEVAVLTAEDIFARFLGLDYTIREAQADLGRALKSNDEDPLVNKAD